jgi:catechol 2,3-dioxygenase-like lactoylglutathione lyase family enzyme
MAVLLNHTIVASRDKKASAEFLSEILGLPAPKAFGPFLGVETGNEVTLDFMDAGGDITVQHYAFIVSEAEFDEIFGRIKAKGLDFWADPFHREPGRINTNDGGRGVYWEDPSGHNLEIITRPYGSGQ